MTEATELLGLLAEGDRLRVVAALVLGHYTSGAIEAVTGLDARRVARAVGRLQAGSLLTTGPEGLRLRAERFEAAVRAAAPPVGLPAETDPGRATVLRAFFRDGRLTAVPTQRSKRLVVLDQLARIFEVGQRYPEAEVDAQLRTFHPDVATLRRYLVDEEFLSRDNRVYWRTGGTVEV